MPRDTSTSVNPLRSLREATRRRFFDVLARAFATHDGRAIAADTLAGAMHHPADLEWGRQPAAPYAGLGCTSSALRASDRPDPIIITARFRSGSTLLWNLFRHIDCCTAYYEPLNERRWFDKAARGAHTDATHRDVSEYWREYDGLEELGRFYRESWIDRDLYMSAEAWNPDLKTYVSVMIDRAPGRPVLQFNRIDFRLPWFRRHFPHARIVHLVRHPRDQWCSTLIDHSAVPRDVSIQQFEPYDHYYLRNWALDLRRYFPFLDERRETHAYRLFYYIWRLSYLYGVTYADYSLAYEQLVADPADSIDELMRAVDERRYDREQLAAMIGPQPRDRWKAFADDAWFTAHESVCEEVLRDYLGPIARPERQARTPQLARQMRDGVGVL